MPASPVQDRRQRLRERLRAEFIAGAEEEWCRRTGPPMTAEELDRLLRRYPGNPMVSREDGPDAAR